MKGKEKLKKRLLCKGTQLDVNNLAEYMHNQYEKHSKQGNWETQKSCKEKPFDKLPEENQEVMKDLAKDMLIWRAEAIQERDEEVLKLIDKLENPYPQDVFDWYSKRKPQFTIGRFNQHCFDIWENCKDRLKQELKELK